MQAAKYIDTLEFEEGFNGDIIKVLEKNFVKARNQVKGFHKEFQADTIEEIAENVWNYLKENINYKADGQVHQKVRLPARFIEDAEGDCKSYSLFACAILSHYTDVAFRYASYRPDPTPTHVYCLCKDEQGKLIIVDGVFNYFNSQKLPITNKIDHWMKISTLEEDVNGIGEVDVEANEIPLDNYTFNVIKHWSRLAASYPKGSKERNYAEDRVKYYIKEANITKDDLAGIGKNGRGKAKLKSLFKKAGKVIKGAVKVVKGVGMAPLRIDFLGLVRINYRGFATRLATALATGNEPAIRKLWQDRFGGSMKSLGKAIDAGKNKKALFGSPKSKIHGIGVAPVALAAIIASAAPILIAISKLIPKGKDGSDDETVDPDSGESLDPDSQDSFMAGEKGLDLAGQVGEGIQKFGRLISGGAKEFESDFSNAHATDKDSKGPGMNPLLIGGLLLGGILIIKK